MAARLLAGWIIACTVWLAGGPGAEAQQKTKINFKLCWTASGMDTPLFLGIERGYFAEEGLDVDISDVLGSGTCFKLMSEGLVQLANPDFGALTKAVARGVNIKGIHGIIERSYMVVVSRADKPIKNPRELEGRMIAMAPGESTALIYPALLAANGVDAKKITLVTPAEGAKLALFLNGNVDAITAASNVQVPVIRSKGTRIHMFSYADFGANVMSNGIAADVKWLEKNEETARRFLKATSRAYKAALADPNASVAAFIKQRPDQKDQRDVLLDQLKETFPLLRTARTKDKPLGWMAKEDWEETQEIMFKYGGLEQKAPVESYYTNKYISD